MFLKFYTLKMDYEMIENDKKKLIIKFQIETFN